MQLLLNLQKIRFCDGEIFVHVLELPGQLTAGLARLFLQQNKAPDIQVLHDRMICAVDNAEFLRWLKENFNLESEHKIDHGEGAAEGFICEFTPRKDEMCSFCHQFATGKQVCGG